ncbi:hypothetical protein FACS1894154_09650 [Betaproteobacteria bacterium]|nr:hypothetical protein FACS1894154_09650 [Betaproteobacteria bacterium]GHU24201.1 hypothetical protein FACS189488_08350 [Betaproteobacteria bacterium]
MKLLSTALVAAGLLAVALPSQAATFHFTGNITYHNDVITIPFTLDADATDVRVYTDSFLSSLNFDPITALWGGDGTRLAQNDDNANINPSVQTWYDSGFYLPTLAAGDYFFTVATYNNWAVGTNISAGFIFDNQTPILLSDWNQPASHYNMGSQWSVWLEGVSSATNPNPPGAAVPEPSLLALLGLGLMGLGASRLRK